jgi:hypothetical protein
VQLVRAHDTIVLEHRLAGEVVLAEAEREGAALHLPLDGVHDPGGERLGLVPRREAREQAGLAHHGGGAAGSCQTSDSLRSCGSTPPEVVISGFSANGVVWSSPSQSVATNSTFRAARDSSRCASSLLLM